MPRSPKDTDAFTSLRGYVGQVNAIWEYAPRTLNETQYVMDRLYALGATAIIRTGLGVWRIIVEGVEHVEVYSSREAALAAIYAERGCTMPPGF